MRMKYHPLSPPKEAALTSWAAGAHWRGNPDGAATC